jgi:hypothetical protein
MNYSTVSILDFAYRLGFKSLYDWQCKMLLRYEAGEPVAGGLRQLYWQDERRDEILDTRSNYHQLDRVFPTLKEKGLEGSQRSERAAFIDQENANEPFLRSELYNYKTRV